MESVSAHREEIYELAEAIHKYPEISSQEYHTTSLIRSKLETLGIEVFQAPSLKTGVIGIIHGGMPGITVALRADIDALPIQESAAHSIRSQNTGVMHACGHDIHTAALLGAAMALQENREQLKGTVVVIFQPAEETSVGAQMVLETDVFEKLHIEAIFALHVMPDIPSGAVGLSQGDVMAAQECFTIRITGTGGHGAAPHCTRDPIAAGTLMIAAIQSLMYRTIDPLLPFVVSVCSVHAGTACNIIPDQMELGGTLRFADQSQREKICRSIEQIAESTALAGNCEAGTTFFRSLPPVYNDPVLFPAAQASATAVFGEGHIVPQVFHMSSEDFSVYREKCPAIMLFVGAGTEEDHYPLHNSQFHAGGEVLIQSAQLLAQIAVEAQT